MKTDILVIGAGASGLMAAYQAASSLSAAGAVCQVTVLEKMPRAGRKIMITGKGRCNFSNVKDWNEFSAHVQSNPNLVKTAFYNLDPEALIDFFESHGMHSVVERGDRAFPESHHASDVVDALVNACNGVGVKIEYECEVASVEAHERSFTVTLSDDRVYYAQRLIVATGGLSYPTTGSTGDGYRFASESGHSISPLFPSLTALVPKGYKDAFRDDADPYHIDRSSPLSEMGKTLCGVSLKNVGLNLFVEGNLAQSEFGDIDFTDGGLEGPVGFQISRKAVKSLRNGSKVVVSIDLKPGVDLTDLTERVNALWKEVDKDPRSVRLKEKEKCRILLGKLMPWDLIPAFRMCNPQILTLERRGRNDSKVWVNLVSIAKALKDWRLEISGHVGWERCVITAGGVEASCVVPKTMESRIVKGMYFCGEVLDMDCDTGGYNLQLAFSTGALAGSAAAKSMII